jgi:signal recognition particle receptor subunit beta
MLAHRLEDVREAMAISPEVPLVTCDARDRESTKQTLIQLVEHAMQHWMARAR